MAISVTLRETRTQIPKPPVIAGEFGPKFALKITIMLHKLRPVFWLVVNNGKLAETL